MRDGGRSSAITVQAGVANHRQRLPVNAGGRERDGKGTARIVSGVGREDERERTTVEVSKGSRCRQNRGHVLGPRRSPGGSCLLPGRRPACRWRDPGLGSCVKRGNLPTAFWPRVGWVRENPSGGIREGSVPKVGRKGRTVS
jgi:hypothetical protein